MWDCPRKLAETSWWIYNHLHINNGQLLGTVAFNVEWLTWTVQEVSKVSIHDEHKEEPNGTQISLAIQRQHIIGLKVGHRKCT